jgi:DNA-binding transcriptional LysR family regulator
MDRLESMTVLLEVVEAGSLSGAGRKLGVPLTTISRKISELEAHLSARLLVRSNRRVGLTDAGQAYVAACRRILADVSEAERAASGEYTMARGELAVTAPVVFGRMHLVPVVADFLAAYPEVDIRLTLADRVLHLNDDHVDLALRIGPLPDSGLKAIRLGAVGKVICASPVYLAARGTPGTPEALSMHSCVTFSGVDQPDHWVFRQDGRDHSVRVRSRLVVNTAEAAIDAVTAGLGLTRVLSYQIAPAIRTRALVTVLQDHAPQSLPVSLLFAGQGPLPQKLRAFLDYATPRLRARLQEAQAA